MQEMSAQLQRHKPMDVYNKLTLKHNFLDLVVGNKFIIKKPRLVFHNENLANRIWELRGGTFYFLNPSLGTRWSYIYNIKGI